MDLIGPGGGCLVGWLLLGWCGYVARRRIVYQPLLECAGGQLWVQAVLMGGRMAPIEEVSPIGVKLDDVPEPGG